MNEKIEQENAETIEETTEPNTEQAQDKKPKVMFTHEQQLQINSLLKREREKEEAKWKDLLSAKDTEVAELSQDWDAILEAQTADFPPAVKSLLSGMSVTERKVKLKDEEFMKLVRQEKGKQPKTPKTEGEQQPKKLVPFGGR